ncbi:MAG: serine hydrolase [Rudaea sp.]|uniref:serine hydrolase domain-containing protein n=1 Tax=unclassified Rudaea TaxID=2627037 RepID=UPI0010F91A5A|nr:MULTISPECIES: serine hydrolase [unclassified Rudaea]MBN8887286.1 serine hydrolase [Rudaea sp.]MBR0344446.1 serine hydrolase [Rudaea sp.]
MWLRILKWALGVIFVVVLGAAAWVAPKGKDVLRVATGSVSRSLCSAAFVSHVDPDRVYAEEQRPRLSVLDWAMRYTVDRDHHEVRAAVAGAFAARTVYREGLGCLVVHGADVPEAAGIEAPSFADAFAEQNAVVEPADPALRKALDGAFAEPDPKDPRNTKAFVVLHDGRLIAERYAPGYGPDTPIWAHSLSKSLTNALIGILVRENKLGVGEPARLAAWQEPSDPHRTVTVDQLLRMTSGLPFDDNDDPINHLTRMMFLERDMAGYAAKVPLDHPPGAAWGYSNTGYMVLSRLVRDAVGKSAADVERFARRELFEPLGMRTAQLDCDATGTPIGASNSYASARDWARFGQLYLDDGVVAGRRILPETWVAYSRTQTLDTGYGAGFWTNLVDHGSVPVWNAPWGMPQLPKDMFYARGALGQYIVIVPSERLVVVRMGMGYGGVESAIVQIIAALHAQANQ